MTLPQAIALALMLGAPAALIIRMAFFNQPPSGREHTTDWFGGDGSAGDSGFGHHGGHH